MKRRRSLIRLLLILVLAAQLTLFTPITNAGTRFQTSKCTGTLTATAGELSFTKAISFLVLGSVTGFNLSYSAVINGILYSVSASGTCVPN